MQKSLCLYEELALLALHNEKGTHADGYTDYAVAGAILAELLLNGCIEFDDTRKQTVKVIQAPSTGDPLLDESITAIQASKRPASLQKWVYRLAVIKEFRHKVARQLCARGILRAGEDKVLLMFKRKIYPEINPSPEKEIIERLRQAIFGPGKPLNPRTVILISLADSADLLRGSFGRKEIKSRKKRIEEIVNGERTGKATKEVIAGVHAAIMVSAILPALIASTPSN